MSAIILHLTIGRAVVGLICISCLFALAVGAKHEGDDDFNP